MREQLYTVRQAAELMGCSAEWVYSLLASRRLTNTPLPGSSRLWVSKSKIVQYLAEHGSPPYPQSLRRDIVKAQRR